MSCKSFILALAMAIGLWSFLFVPPASAQDCYDQRGNPVPCSNQEDQEDKDKPTKTRVPPLQTRTPTATETSTPTSTATETRTPTPAFTSSPTLTKTSGLSAAFNPPEKPEPPSWNTGSIILGSVILAIIVTVLVIVVLILRKPTKALDKSTKALDKPTKALEEAGAVSSLRTLVSAQAMFYQGDVEGNDTYEYATEEDMPEIPKIPTWEDYLEYLKNLFGGRSKPASLEGYMEWLKEWAKINNLYGSGGDSGARPDQDDLAADDASEEKNDEDD